MTVAISDARTIVHEFDSTTGLSSPVGGEALVVFTADPNPIEAGASVGMAVSTETADIVATITAVDQSAGVLVYVWVLANGTMDTQANGGTQAIIGDGTNTIGYHVAGSDKASFRYNDGQVGWQCLLIDTGSLPATTTAHRGTAGSITLTALTEYGAGYKTLSKALGGASNCFTDIVRYGNGGIIITAGASGGTEGKFSEIATADSSNANQAAYGGVHELAAGAFGVQIGLTFGDNAGTAATYFADQDVSVIFEDRGIGTDKYFIKVAGNATGSTTFKLGLKSGTDGGTNGVSLICPTGVGASFDASDADLQFCLMYGGTLSGYDQGVTFSSDATNAPNHEVYDYTFSGCSQIDPGLVPFKNNTIADTTDSLTGGLLGNIDLDGHSFSSGGSGHAIYITSTGTYTYTSNSFVGYGLTATTDAVIYNNSGGLVTINVSSGDTPTYRNGAGATTAIVASVPLSFEAVDKQNTAINTLQVSAYLVSDDSLVIIQDTDGTGFVTGSFSGTTPADIYYRYRKASAGDTKYVNISGLATIESGSGVSIKRSMEVDTNNNA